jgi:hypothetical protein
VAALTSKSQIAYTQYIKIALERIRELKEKGHDVSEANRILQSIVAAVMDNDINCADFLINELEAVFKRIESFVPPASFSVSSQVEKTAIGTSRVMPTVSGMLETEPLKYVVRSIDIPPGAENSNSKIILAFIYVFLFLFAATVVSLIVYLLKWST